MARQFRDVHDYVDAWFAGDVGEVERDLKTYLADREINAQSRFEFLLLLAGKIHEANQRHYLSGATDASIFREMLAKLMYEQWLADLPSDYFG